ncbi:hypothetical protein [Georgenia sp. AZ-5]|uniref:hypothetical protein n=1 Tax=Georgenia sp. AZ-5 TaxID=3367526 RepID=UPI0037550EF6
MLQFAFAQAVRRGVGVRVVHGRSREIPRPEFLDDSVERLLASVAEEQALDVERIASTWDRYPGVPVDVREVRRHPVEALVEESADASLSWAAGAAAASLACAWAR